MSVVDLAKARAYAATGLTCTDTAADWILSLADEVESLQRALTQERQACAALVTENADLGTGLEQLLRQVAELLALAGGKP